MPSSDVTIQVVVNLLLVALGYLIVRLGLLSRRDRLVLSRLVLYVTLPATSLRAMTGATLEPRILARDKARTLAVHTAVKYGLGGLLALALVLALPYRGPERAIAFMVQLMPAPLSTLLYSVEQRLNARLAAKFVSLGIVVSLVLATIAVLGFRSAF
jgi:predicted permease